MIEGWGALLKRETLLNIPVSCNKSGQGRVLKLVVIHLLEAALSAEELHDPTQTVFIHVRLGSHVFNRNGSAQRHNAKVVEAQRNLPSGQIMVAAAESANPLQRTVGKES